MQISIKSINLPESTIKNFAGFLGWKETLSQGVDDEISNPQTFIQFIEEKYGSPIWQDISNWNLQTAEHQAKLLQDQANVIIEQARVLTDARAKQIVTVNVE